MKFVSFFWFLTIAFHSAGQQAKPTNCHLLELFLLDSIFQKSGPSCILSADTLHIWDGGNYFATCSLPDVNGIPLLIHPLSEPSYKHIPALDIYNYHFLITRLVTTQDTMRIAFFKKHSNHHGFLEYEIKNHKLILIKREVGQY